MSRALTGQLPLLEDLDPVAPPPSAAGRGRDKPTDPGGIAHPGSPGWSLRQFDIVLINTSGGKDSQVALRRVVLQAEAERVTARLVVQHNNLGRPEWPGTLELAAIQAHRYGLDLVARRRPGPDLLDDVETRKTRAGEPRGFPTRNFRYCTSDHKTAVSRSLIVALARQIIKDAGGIRRFGRHVRVLQVFGFRAQESTERANREPFGFNPDASNNTTRDVWDWLPIHDLTERQVWSDIRVSGDPYHPIYDERMPRLSCSFCIYGSLLSLGIAKRFRGDLAAEYERVERKVGPFQDTRTLASVPVAPGRRYAEYVVRVAECPTCATPLIAHESQPVRYCPAHAPTGPWDWSAHNIEPGPPCASSGLFTQVEIGAPS